MIVNTHFPGYAAQNREAAQVCVVLVQDTTRGFRCYLALVGPCHNDEARAAAAEWTAQFGSKLRLSEARIHFPQIPAERYNV